MAGEGPEPAAQGRKRSAEAAARVVVAIDGPAGAGKSTIARRVAGALGWAYLDTGAMYRALTWRALDEGLDPTDGAAIAACAAGLDLVLGADGRVTVDGADVTAHLRTVAVNDAVSTIAAIPAVREVMVAHQRRFAARNGRIVAEGRDIGTVVFPDAAVKVFLDADPGERARRRLAETLAAGGARPEDAARLAEQMARRDHLDRTRTVAPLRPAADARGIDTTSMTLDEVVAAVLATVHSALST
jgi:cytidylate kinase